MMKGYLSPERAFSNAFDSLTPDPGARYRVTEDKHIVIDDETFPLRVVVEGLVGVPRFEPDGLHISQLHEWWIRSRLNGPHGIQRGYGAAEGCVRDAIRATCTDHDFTRTAQASDSAETSIALETRYLTSGKHE
jgi:hypothetical protein